MMAQQPLGGNTPTVRLRPVPSRTARWRVPGRLAMAILAALSLYFVGMGFVRYRDFLHTGFTGAWCLTCDYPGGRPELHIVPNSPADRAGLAQGDVLVAVDGVDAASLDAGGLETVEPGTYGQAGTTVIVTVRHADGTVRDHTLVREEGWEDLATTGLRVLGASGQLSVTIALVVDSIILLGYAAAACLMVWRRPHDGLVMFAGLVLLMAAVYATRGYIYFPASTFRAIYLPLVLTACITLIFIFPNGKLVPRWAMYVAAPYTAWLLFHAFVVRALAGSFDPTRAIDLPFWGIALGAQVYRYRRLSTPEQRQQTKWVVVGLAAAFIQRALFLAVGSLAPALSLFTSATALSHGYWSIGDMVSRLALLAFPFTFILALLRYRLWDVDFIINRSLIYGSLTALLVVVFGAILLGGQSAYQAFTGNSQAPPALVMAATLAAAGLFQPARTELRRFVDRRLYAIEIDYERAAHEYAIFKREADQSAALAQPQLGGYTRLELLGRGGMGEVYKARHPMLGRIVAIKVLPAHLISDVNTRERFIREAQTVARLKHPNIVNIYDFGESDGVPYMIMEYIDGPNLITLLERGDPLPIERVRTIVSDVASALDYAHSQGLVHRDVKPSNVMLEPVPTPDLSRRAERAVLMDFGIARMAAASSRLTGTGVVGTFSYIAPEQIRDDDQVDGRADIYALGVMFYQMVTGQLPFKSNNVAALLIAHLNQPPPDPRTVRPDLPPDIATAILKALEKDPARRFNTAGEMALAIQAELSEPTSR